MPARRPTCATPRALAPAACALALPATSAQAEGYVLGAGRWPRAEIGGEVGGEVGGETVLRKTVEECRKAPPDTPFSILVNSMIANTK